MRRVRVARRVLGRERRDDVGVVVLLLLLLDEEVRRVRMCRFRTRSCSEEELEWLGSAANC
jgi:hypothetical protein